MSADTSNETGVVHEYNTERRRKALTSNGLRLAETIWGIERFGRISASAPPPIHITMAWQLATDPELRAALRAALDAVEADG
jgi:hypothetical protein